MLDLEKYKDIVDQFITYGDKVGFIPMQLIIENLPTDGTGDDFLDDVVQYLEEKGYDVTRGENKDNEDFSQDNLNVETFENDLGDFEQTDFDNAEPTESDLVEVEESEIKVSNFENDDQDTFQSDDLIRVFLHEIGQYELLDITQESQLASSVHKGISAKNQLDKAGKNLSEEEILKLQRQVEAGDQAREVLIVSNIRLVVSIAKNYAKNSRSLPLEDLITEGQFGLIKAVEKFDYSRGYKFSTYATWWIRQAILRAIADKGRNVRIPVHMHENINKLARVRRKLTQELHREPTNEELAAEMKITVDKVVDLQKVSQDSISFDNSVGDEDDSTLIDLVPDDTTATPYEYTEQLMFKKTVEDVLKTLTPREEMVLRYRYGIGTDHPCTLEEVGRIMHITRERVRQIESKALDRMNLPSRKSRLEAFIK